MFGFMNQTPMYNPNLPVQMPQFGLGNMFQQPYKIPKVKGKDGANALSMPNGSEVLAFDLDEPIIWLIQTDDAGIRTIDGLDVAPHVDPEKRTIETLEERVRKLEEALKREPAIVDVTYTEQSTAGGSSLE